MSNRNSNTQQRGFSYSSQVAELFLPRHRKLEILHKAYINRQELEGTMRNYTSQLLYEWTNYLQDDEALLLDFRPLKTRDLFTRARSSPDIHNQWINRDRKLITPLTTIDGVFNKGILPEAFQHTTFPFKEFRDFLQPEKYVLTLGFQYLLSAVQQLTDDTHVYDFKSGKRKGEVCLTCERVDP